MLKEQLTAGAERNPAWVEVSSGATVSELAASLGLPERHLFAILVNGTKADTSRELQEGDEVTFMPPFSGG